MPRSRSRSRSRSPRSGRERHRRRYEEGRRYEETRHDRRDRGERGRDQEGRSGREKRDERRSPREERERDSGREKRESTRSSREKSNNPDERIIRREDPRARFQVHDTESTPATGANAPLPEKEAPNFAQTGLLAAAANTVNGVVLKYSEPAEARKPPASQRWRLFVFKDKEIVDTVDLNKSSCWLIGRDRAIADLPVDHPSCSKQHAVLQFRHISKVGEFGDKEAAVKPYIIDLESANGTTVGKVRAPERRYLELKEGDLIMFGLSTREYILMLEKD